ncbi:MULTISPECIES: helix-turn-helix domain-containing protein [Vibrio]|uniref:Helix-turn-helix transcriptional regulator n=1 Tax=Vibrio navarrensis TaxID=29495 RepID=A0AAJ4IBY0_9VIBR|nr:MULTISPECIES: helix-turn-helix domain-containing protein [Vibrio]KJR31873.1 DNA-binding protein [Vibrio sp. S234-5]MBE4605200.1 transcriptional regulator [Vibrio navarrensis]QPL53941.1 helix-turn-helix transcriptional regulator [Vibrio navarrensis]
MRKGKMVKAQPMPDLNTEFSMETLGSAIRSKRTDRGWRIDDLASKANLSRRTVMKVENGDTSVTFANVLVLMDILGLSLRLIDLKLVVRPHSQITSQAENSVRNSEGGWYE